jgi:hypothetical protein
MQTAVAALVSFACATVLLLLVCAGHWDIAAETFLGIVVSCGALILVGWLLEKADSQAAHEELDDAE